MWKFSEASGGDTMKDVAEKKREDAKIDSKMWEEFARIHGSEKKEPSAAVAKIVPFLKQHGVKDILDDACGYGRNALFLKKQGFNVDALDRAKEALEILKRNATKEGLQIQTILADDRKTRLPDESYDAVISVLGLDLHKKSEWKDAVGEMVRLTRKGKYVLVTGNFKDEDMEELMPLLKSFNLTHIPYEGLDNGGIRGILLEKK
jgi:ubiquinone/menaquinone biosynthesis C-methylase UbiE